MAGVLIARGAVVDYQNKVRQSCMICIITVVLSMIVGIIIIMSTSGDVSRAPVHTGSMLCIHYSNASTIDNVCIHRDFPSPKSCLALIQCPLAGIVFIVI